MLIIKAITALINKTKPLADSSLKNDLKGEVKENTLSIYGCKEDKDSDEFFHKGISNRSFTKSFQLHKQIVIDGAKLKDGILSVKYHREIPESEKPRTIDIKKG